MDEETSITWDDLDLKMELLRGIFAYGFEHPSPIQQKAIRPIMEGKDMLVQAQSGTGKTATFAIGALSRIDENERKMQALILSPTKELTTQTATVCGRLGQMMKGLRVQNTYDTKQPQQCHILCGCPGKVLKFLERDQLDFHDLKLLILDEADELLSDGFQEQVYQICQYLPSTVQIVLVSATVPAATMRLAEQLLRDPVHIVVRPEQLTLEGISQYFVAVHQPKHKYEVLEDLFSHLQVSQSIIYCNSVDSVMKVHDYMKEKGFPVRFIHSRMETEERQAAFADFRSGKSRVLISSDLTARGLDVQQVSIVINFDIPNSVETYLHRIGRSGRWGRKGVGLNFMVINRDRMKMREIEKHYGTTIQELPHDLSCLQV